MRVLILHDAVDAAARADELDVLVQADVVARALGELGHEPEAQPFGLDLSAARDAIAAARPDVVFNLVESVDRRGSLIHLAPALLDRIGVPYTGNRTAAVFLTSGKLLAKQWLARAGLPTPPWRTLGELRAGAALDAPLAIVKSVWEHGSVGLDEDAVLEAASASDLVRAIEARLRSFLGDGFAETYVDGREFNLALLEADGAPEVLPPAEIRFEGYGAGKRKVVGYRAKWDEASFEFRNTPRRFDFAARDASLLAELRGLALEAWKLFGLQGYARVDFRVDGAGRPWILEINTNPCLSPDAGYAAALARAGLDLPAAVARLLSAARRGR